VWSRVTVRHGKEFARHVVPAVVKPARTLWNDFIAFLFFCLAIPFGFETVRFARAYAKASPAEAGGDMFRMCMSGFFLIVMLWFGLSSYLKARKISRS